MSHTFSSRFDALQAASDFLLEIQDRLTLLNEALSDPPNLELNLHKLKEDVRYPLELIQERLSEALQALDILERQVPIANNFPDGTPAPVRLTSRQVILLSKLTR